MARAFPATQPSIMQGEHPSGVGVGVCVLCVCERVCVGAHGAILALAPPPFPIADLDSQPGGERAKSLGGVIC